MFNLKKFATHLRISIIKMIAQAGSGHPASSLGMADVFAVLYFGGVLQYKPKNPDWPERDRLLLSAGHICPLLYTVLAHAGFYSKKELSTLRKFGSNLQGHPDHLSLAGVEISAGSLGQGFSTACGMALALKLDTPSTPLQPSQPPVLKLRRPRKLRRAGKRGEPKIFAVTSDGEHNEGQTWEAVMFANKYKLNNLINIIDRNKIQIDGSTEDVMPLRDLAQKYRSFGWKILEMDGHKIEEIASILKQAKQEQDGPIAVIAHTVPGKGVSFMEGKHEWHGKALDQDEAEKAIKELS